MEKGGRMKIGFDIDGVLCSFEYGYRRLLIDVLGKDIIPAWLEHEGPPVCDWPQHYGVTDAQVTEAWARIMPDNAFWADLPPTQEFPVFKRWWNAHNHRHDIYFITNRMGLEVKKQTELWLANHLVLESVMFSPTVLISGQKGAISKALGLDFYVDDSGGNIQSVNTLSPKTRAYLIDRAYNRHIADVARVDSLTSFLDIVGG
jgi:hypothetical protein